MRVLLVREILRATLRTRIIRLDLNSQGFSFAAGQALLVGRAGSALRKPYSIACSPGQAADMNGLELLVQIDESDTPDPHLERVKPGMPLEVEGPFGDFGLPTPVAEPDILFVAGGTGIAPLRAMLWDVLAHDTDHRLALIYSARSVEEFAYEDELRSLAAEGRLDLRLTVTREGTEGWSGPRGRIDAELIGSVLRTPATRCVLCGPPAMVGTTTALLKAAGVSEHEILTETFQI